MPGHDRDETWSGPLTDPLQSSRAVTTQEILEELDQAIAEHMAWLKVWHRALLCGGTTSIRDLDSDPDDLGRFGVWYMKNQHSGLVDQQALRSLANRYLDMRARARKLMHKVADGDQLPPQEYDAFMDNAAAFVAQARRLEKAFAAASSHLDPLTGLHNRQVMDMDLERERERFIRTGHPCCVALGDIDHFKAVNDEHGHAAGDKVLFATSECFLRHMRPYDSVYRYGGEEFLFCLLDIDAATAAKIMDRLRGILANNRLSLDDGTELRITASFGIAQMDEQATAQDVIERADKALYAAKLGGRNQVCVWPLA